MRGDDLETCYFAASREINHQILDEVEPRLRTKIAMNIAADLTKVDKSELLQFFMSPA